MCQTGATLNGTLWNKYPPRKSLPQLKLLSHGKRAASWHPLVHSYRFPLADVVKFILFQLPSLPPVCVLCVWNAIPSPASGRYARPTPGVQQDRLRRAHGSDRKCRILPEDCLRPPLASCQLSLGGNMEIESNYNAIPTNAWHIIPDEHSAAGAWEKTGRTVGCLCKLAYPFLGETCWVFLVWCSFLALHVRYFSDCV